MLFRATTAMGLFERALDERGIPVHVVGGRGYWGQQQVADLRHWLAALANPLDGLALYRCSPRRSAGLSLDAARADSAARPRRSALGVRGGWCASPPTSSPARCPSATGGGCDAFVERFEAERRIVGQVSLETLIDRAVTRTGYDRHLLALPGRRRAGWRTCAS